MFSHTRLWLLFYSMFIWCTTSTVPNSNQIFQLVHNLNWKYKHHAWWSPYFVYESDFCNRPEIELDMWFFYCVWFDVYDLILSFEKVRLKFRDCLGKLMVLEETAKGSLTWNFDLFEIVALLTKFREESKLVPLTPGMMSDVVFV